MKRLGAAILLFLLSLAPQALAVNPDEVLADPALEARARHLSTQLRCMVCQNQSIDDSNAELAKDLRLLVRERISKGDSDEQVIDYLVSRYGQFVLLKPRLSPETLGLWGAPVLFLAFGGAAALLYLRRRGDRGSIAALTPQEEARLKRLMEEGPGA
ncbi:cytochrome c-type biogenesis protein [Allorhizobium undicola]|uniref:cytochrome c-type biogenesis protein n=1 Tax=Allorhizobium undicola TaxID=78527 RepID=UPI003D34AC2F